MKSLDKYDDYFKGNMSEDHADDFTKEVLRNHYDSELKSKWNTILDAQKEEQVEESVVTPIDQKPTKVRTLYKAIAFAAGFLLLLGLYFVNVESISPNQPGLAEAHLATPFPYNEIRKGEVEMSVRREMAGEDYMLKSYDEAITGYQKVIALDGGQSADFFYLGLSYLYSDNVEQSITQFHQVLESGDDQFKKDATWFLSLAYLKIDKLDEAKIYLNKVSTWGEASDARGRHKKMANEANTILEKIK